MLEDCICTVSTKTHNTDITSCEVGSLQKRSASPKPARQEGLDLYPK